MEFFELSNTYYYCKPKEESSKSCAILLIHGFGASTDHWRFNIPVLSDKYEVHAIDLLGFGKSPKPTDVQYSSHLWKDQVATYVKEVIKKPTFIVGNSLGCLLYTSPSPRDLSTSRMPSSA